MAGWIFRVTCAVGALLLTAATATPTAATAQTPFPHSAHDRLFPLCSGCHEVDDPSDPLYPAATLCGECHDGDQAPEVAWTPPETEPGYTHTAHRTDAEVPLDCEACHTGEGGLGAVTAEDCGECHDAHHTGGIHCRVCHDTSPRPDHEASAHAGCAGSGCHDADLVRGLSFDRELCLVCHADQADHKPGRRCGQCHAVGQPRER